MLGLLAPGMRMGGGGAPAFVAGDRPTWKLPDPGNEWQLTDPGNAWAAREDTVVYARLEKRAGWSRVYNFDFSQFAELVAGETLSGPTVSFTPTGLTVGSPAVSGAVVQVRISSGTAGVEYTGTATVTTSGSSTLTQDGLLEVVD